LATEWQYHRAAECKNQAKNSSAQIGKKGLSRHEGKQKKKQKRKEKSITLILPCKARFKRSQAEEKRSAAQG